MSVEIDWDVLIEELVKLIERLLSVAGTGYLIVMVISLIYLANGPIQRSLEPAEFTLANTAPELLLVIAMGAATQLGVFAIIKGVAWIKKQLSAA